MAVAIFVRQMKNKTADFKNLRILPSGYQVAIMRHRKSVTKHFAGHTDRSYAAAIRHRDQLLRVLPARWSLKAA
jgi:hypothetical protein